MCLTPVYTSAQFNQVNIYPPEAASLMRVVDYPVGHLNGMPDIRIPLFTAKSGQLTLPLDISFHLDNYLRANQMPGIAGAGWSISSEIQITRVINGKDDLAGGYCQNNLVPSNYTSNSPLPQRTRSVLNQMVKGYFDEEPDRFYYNILGKSGAFYFQKQEDGSFKPIPVPFNGIKINYDFDNHQFSIIDTDGTSYVFSKTIKDYVELTPNTFTTVAWKCESIKSAAGQQEITFNYASNYRYLAFSYNDRVEVYDDQREFDLQSAYVPGCVSGSNPSIWKITGPFFVTFGGGISSYFTFTTENGFAETGSWGRGAPGESFNYTKENLVTEIDFRGGRILFTYTGVNQLSSISILNKAGDVTKSVRFFMSYTGSPGQSDFSKNTYYNSRKLDSLIIDDQRYSFDYGFERQYGEVTDFWGYKASAPNKWSGSYSYVPGQEIEYSLGECTYYNNCVHVDPNYDRHFSIGYGSPSNGVSGIFELSSLERKALNINYPTGGRTEFFVEQNRFRDPIDNLIKGTGGYRVNRISYFDDTNTSPVKEKIYKYGPNEDGTGIIKSQPSFDEYSGNNYTKEILTYCYELPTTGFAIISKIRKRTYLSGSTRSLTFDNGAPVNYNEVAEYDSDLGKITGKTVYKYNIYYYTPEYTSPTDPFPFERSDWDIGMPDSVIHYRYSNGQFNWVKRKNMDYNKFLYPNQIFRGRVSLTDNYILEFSQKASPDLTQDKLTEDYGSFNYKTKSIEVGAMQLASEDEAVKDDKGNVTSSKIKYFYNNPDPSVVSRIESTGSDGITTTQDILYPNDYLNGGFVSPLLTNNVISLPVEKVTRRNGKIISGQVSTYNSNGSLASTYQVETMNSNQSSFKMSNKETEGDFSLSNSSSAFSMDSKYEPKLIVNWDNSYLNPIQVTPADNFPASYLWSYNNTYPVVKAENVDYNTLNTAVTSIQSNLQTFLTTSVGNLTTDAQKSAWRSFNTSLRNNASLSKALITTYTYSPLIGITSQTDPNGVTTYYEYDDFGRLKNVRDNDNNIIKRNYYHYYNETTSDGICTLDVSGTLFRLLASATSASFTITSGCRWTISEDADWLTLSQTSGSGNATITVNATANGSANRTAAITINYGSGLTKTINVRQSGALGTISVDASELWFGNTSSLTNTLAITASTSWVVSSYPGWLTIKPASGTGSMSVTITAARATSGSRIGTIVFSTSDGSASVTLPVTQSNNPI
jgi:YD repeat-containing protein